MFKTTSVGISILENLEALYQFCTRNSFSVFCQSVPLIYIFDATNFLIKTGFRNSRVEVSGAPYNAPAHQPQSTY